MDLHLIKITYGEITRDIVPIRHVVCIFRVCGNTREDDHYEKLKSHDVLFSLVKKERMGKY